MNSTSYDSGLSFAAPSLKRYHFFLKKKTIVEMPQGHELDSKNSSRILSGRRSVNTKQEVNLSKALLFMWTRVNN